MYDYASLPTLVLNEIFSYLSVKERIKCKGVCRAWKLEIELREQQRDTLILHVGPYPWNLRWRQTNNSGLMKFENSFEVKVNPKHSVSIKLLEKTKKLAILNFSNCDASLHSPNLQSYLDYFKQFEDIEEIEIRNCLLAGTLNFDLPKLKVLVIEGSLNKLALNCPSLEVLLWNWPIPEIDFRNTKKLKRLICLGWPATVSFGCKLESLEYLELFADDPVDDLPLDQMPKLKRLMVYSNNPQTDLEIIREQQKRNSMKNLEIFFVSLVSVIRPRTAQMGM